MAAQAAKYPEQYPQQLVQVMKEHELIEPEEEKQIVNYLFVTQ